jgi:predicted DNA-binding protein
MTKPIQPPTPTPTAQRGRPTVGIQAMTPAERKRRSRQQLAEQGSTEFSVRLHGGMLTFLTEWAESAGKTRAEILQDIVEEAVTRMRMVIHRADAMAAAGATADEIATAIYEGLSVAGLDDAPTEATKQKMREALE